MITVVLRRLSRSVPFVVTGLYQLLRRRRNKRNRREPAQAERTASRSVQNHLETRVFFPQGKKYDGHPFNPYKVSTPHPASLTGMCVRSSTRWFSVEHSRRMFTPVPFVGNSGKFSGSTLCFWTAYPQQIIASLTATVYQRLLRLISKRHGRKYSKRCRETIFKTAAYYTITHDDSFLDRVLGIFKRRNRRAVHNLYTYAFSTLGEDKRFVISQVCHQALWLTFRSKTVIDPRTYKTEFKRDKPIIEDHSDSSSLLGEVVSEWSQIDIRSVKESSQAWKTLHRYRQATKLPEQMRWSELVVSLSEPLEEFDLDDVRFD